MRFAPSWAAIVVFILGFTITIAVTFEETSLWKLRVSESFQTLVNDSERALAERMERYHLALDALSGYWNASEQIYSESWRSRICRLDVEL